MKKRVFMKKTGWLTMAAVCLLSSWVAAAIVRVDNFDSYTSGQVDLVTANWKGIPPSSAAAVIEADPTNAQNQVLRVISDNDGNDQGVYGILGNAEIANGTTKILFLRFRASSSETNHSLGLTDIDTPTSLGNFRVQLIIDGDTLQIRDGATTRSLTPSINTGSWYNLWVVVDNAADKTKLYLTQGIAGATEANRMKDGAFDTFAFYNGTTNSLDRFFWLTRAVNEERVWSDDVYLMDYPTDSNSLPNPVSLAAHSPTPDNNETGVTITTWYWEEETTTALFWSTGTDPNGSTNPNPEITKHYVSFKKGDSNFASGATLDEVSPVHTTDSWTPPTTGSNAMVLDGTYYWRIDESVNDSSRTEPNTIVGPVWKFETQKSVPAITQQPANVRVFPTETAQFTVAFTSITMPTATWKKYVDGTNDQTIVTGGKYTVTPPTLSEGSYTTTLTVAEPGDTEQGLYYCVLINTGRPESSVTSNSAELVVKKMLAWYEFENNFNDSARDVHGIGKDANDLHVPPVIPTFVPGIVGNSAVAFSGTGAYVDLSVDAYPKAGLGTGMDEGTMCCCAKAAQAGTFYSNYNDNFEGDPTTGFAFSLTSASKVKMDLWGGNYGNVGTVEGKPSEAFNMINDGQWHFVAATWKKGVQMIVYVDGVQVASVTAGSPQGFAAWVHSTTIGASRSAMNRNVLESFYGGAMDNLQVYNYMLDKYAIADLYDDIFHKPVCIEPYASAYDSDGDCKVDIGDFVTFASAWLDCGLYPNSYCP